MPAFSDMLEVWGNQCSQTRKPVVLELTIGACGGLAGAKHEARRIVTGFAALRSRRRAKIMKLPPLERPRRTPWEDVVCRSSPMENKAGMYVHFIPEDSSVLQEMYHEVGTDTPAMLAHLTLNDLLAPQPAIQVVEAKRVSHDPNDIPLDQDPFSFGLEE